MQRNKKHKGPQVSCTTKCEEQMSQMSGALWKIKKSEEPGSLAAAASLLLLFGMRGEAIEGF